MSMVSTPLAVTMETVICSWKESMSTTMKPLVIIFNTPCSILAPLCPALRWL